MILSRIFVRAFHEHTPPPALTRQLLSLSQYRSSLCLMERCSCALSVRISRWPREPNCLDSCLGLTFLRCRSHEDISQDQSLALARSRLVSQDDSRQPAQETVGGRRPRCHQCPREFSMI